MKKLNHRQKSRSTRFTYMKAKPRITSAIQSLILIFIIMQVEVVHAQTYPPSCVVTAPHSNAYFQINSDIVINVYSTDIGKTQQNGIVTKVEFFVDDNKIGESSSHTDNTYSFTWNCVQPGEYRITAKATNDKGVSFTSVGQFVTVGIDAVTSYGMSANRGKYLANTIPDSPKLKFNEYWNGVTAANSCKWGSVERDRDVMRFSGADVAYNHAKDNNLMFRYHAIVWGNQTPIWLEGLQNDVPAFRAELEEYIVAVADRYKYMDQVDVLNEQIGRHAPNTQWFRNGLGGPGSTGYDWVVYLFERARELLPNTKLIVNDYGLVTSSTNIGIQLELMSHLRDRGLIDGFGTQSHEFSVDRISASGLQDNLDQMATGGVPIYVTELDLRGGVANEENEPEQLASYQTHFPVYWEHPHVAGITIWGYIAGTTWINGTGLLRSNGDEKQALTWLKNYVGGKPDVGYPYGTIPGSCCETPAPSVSQTLHMYEVGDVATQLSATGSSLTWYMPDGSTASSAPTPSTATEGTYYYAVTQTGICESSRTTISVIVYEPQGAYGGAPTAIPGRIEFENFDTGGQDTAYYDSSPGTSVPTPPDFRPDEDVDIETCSDIDGGYNIGYATSGEWLEYTVDVAATGVYDLEIRVACDGDGRTISLESNGTAIASDVAIPNTGGWQDWETVTISDIELDAGIQIIRMTIGDVDYVNLNYMVFTSLSVGPTVDISSPLEGAEFTTNDEILIEADASATDATITNLQFYIDDQLMFTDDTSPYSYSWTQLTAGSHEITAIATDNNGGTSSETINVSVTQGSISIELYTGWNLIGCPLEGDTPIENALSSIWSNILTVKDMETYYQRNQPEHLNSLNTLNWGKGYLIKVSEDCELSW